MTDEYIFAGVDFAAGRQPVTVAVLDDALRVVLLERCAVVRLVEHLKPYDRVSLVLNVPSTPRLADTCSGLEQSLYQAGFKPYDAKNARKQLIETNAQDCFRTLLGRKPFPRRSLEGRVQRGLILYEQGVRIADPMDFFEELTSHHILDGIFPNELLNSASELDALASAHLAWLAVNEPGRTRTLGNTFVVPREPERE